MKVEVKNVTKSFEKVKVLENVNLQLDGGKIYAFIGPNGCGKTVLLKMICGFYEPTSGEILIDGKNIHQEKSYPENTGALIEKPSFIPDLTGKENLLFLANINKKIGEKEIDKIVHLIDLEKYIDNKYNTYSLGTKQKLGIAQAIMENPSLLILDEPFNGLDDKSAEKIRKYLKDLKQKNALIILSTHIKEDIESLSDVVYTIEDQRIFLKHK